MLLGGKGGCQQCTCVPCDACTRTCQNPFTGTEFEAVFTRYFEGVEAGNPSDGYLTASGDSDTSDPYDGMDGLGPWFQQITGGFTLNSTQTRFPCRVLVSFWRNNYTLGAATIPPASTALTSNKVYVTVSDGAVIVGDLIIVPADGEVEITTFSVPLVTGGGDQSGNIPRFYEGSVYVAPQCQSASFSIRARIEWNTQKRQHVLYGLVRECYEEGTPCATDCSGAGRPSVVYVTISNFSLDPGATYYSSSISNVNGTYALDRVANICTLWFGPETGDGCAGFTNAGQFVETGSNREFTADVRLYIRTGYTAGGLSLCMNPLVLTVPTGTLPAICGTGVIASGASTGATSINRIDSGALVEIASCTFDWEVSA